MRKNPKVAIVIPNWNGRELLRSCLESIKKNTSYPNYEITVVDDASTDGSVDMVKKEFPDVRLIRNKENLGFPKACNRGIKYALEKCNLDYVLLQNNDTEIIQKGWLEALIEVAERDGKIGIVGCKVIHPNGELQRTAGFVKPWKGNLVELSDNEKITEVDIVGGQAFLIRKEVIGKIGLLDEGFSPFLWEDSDYDIRVKKAGYKIVFDPKATLIHHGGASIKKKDKNAGFFVYKRNKIRFMLLNFPLKWIILETPYDILSLFLEKKDKRVGLNLTNVKLRRNFSKNLGLFSKVYWVNLKNLREIIGKRKNRTAKIWY